MPNLDKTGPKGQGPMTGRGRGVCPTCGVPCQIKGTGRGRGLGLRHFWASPDNTVQDLKDIKLKLEEELEAIKTDIASAEKQE